jgi:hypothetical protein
MTFSAQDPASPQINPQVELENALAEHRLALAAVNADRQRWIDRVRVLEERLAEIRRVCR